MFKKFLVVILLAVNLGSCGYLSQSRVDDYSKCSPQEQTLNNILGSTVRIKSKEGLGTGVVIDRSGTVVTSTHVIGTDMKVSDFNNSYEYEVKSKGEPDSISTLRPKQLTQFPRFFVSKIAKFRYGMEVFSIGFPYGYERVLSHGFVSGVHDSRMAVVNLGSTMPGMSGSGIFSCNSELIGIILGHDRRDSSLGIFNPISELDKL